MVIVVALNLACYHLLLFIIKLLYQLMIKRNQILPQKRDCLH